MKSSSPFPVLRVVIALSKNCPPLLQSVKQSSNQLVSDSISQFAGLGIVSALFGISHCFRSRYKDQLFSFFLERSLPGLALPSLKVEWETFQTITAQQLSFSKKESGTLSVDKKGQGETSLHGGVHPLEGVVSPLERVDLYSDTMLLKVQPPWQKIVNQQYRGLIPLLAPGVEQVSLRDRDLACKGGGGWVELIPRDLVKLRGRRFFLFNSQVKNSPLRRVVSPASTKWSELSYVEAGRCRQLPHEIEKGREASRIVDPLSQQAVIGREENSAPAPKRDQLPYQPLITRVMPTREAGFQEEGKESMRLRREVEIHPLLSHHVESRAFASAWAKGRDVVKQGSLSSFPLSFPVTSQGRTLSRKGKMGWIETFSLFYDELPWKVGDQGEGISPPLQKRNHPQRVRARRKSVDEQGSLSQVGQAMVAKNRLHASLSLKGSKQKLSKDGLVQQQSLDGRLSTGHYLPARRSPLHHGNNKGLVERILKRAHLIRLSGEIPSDDDVMNFKATLHERVIASARAALLRVVSSTPRSEQSKDHFFDLKSRNGTLFQKVPDVRQAEVAELEKEVVTGEKQARGGRERRSLFDRSMQHVEGSMRQLFYHSGTIPPLACHLTEEASPLGKEEVNLRRAMIEWMREKKAFSPLLLTPRQVVLLKRCLLGRQAILQNNRSKRALLKSKRGGDKWLNGLSLPPPVQEGGKQEAWEVATFLNLSTKRRVTNRLKRIAGKTSPVCKSRLTTNDWMSPRTMSGYAYPDVTNQELIRLYCRLAFNKLLSLSLPLPERVAIEATLLDMQVTLPPSIGTLFHTRLPLKNGAQGGNLLFPGAACRVEGKVGGDSMVGKPILLKEDERVARDVQALLKEGEYLDQPGDQQTAQPGKQEGEWQLPSREKWAERFPGEVLYEDISLSPYFERGVNEILAEMVAPKRKKLEVDVRRGLITRYEGPGISLQREQYGNHQGIVVSFSCEPLTLTKEWADNRVGKSKRTPTSAWTTHFFGKKRYVRAGRSRGNRIKKITERKHLRYQLGVKGQISRRFLPSTSQTPEGEAEKGYRSPFKQGRIRVAKCWHCQPKLRRGAKKRRYRLLKRKGDKFFTPLPLWGRGHPIGVNKNEWYLLVRAQLRRDLYLQQAPWLALKQARKKVGDKGGFQRRKLEEWHRREKTRIRPLVPLSWPSILLDRVRDGPANWPLTQSDFQDVSTLLFSTLSPQPILRREGISTPAATMTRIVRHYHPMTGCAIPGYETSLSFFQPMSQKRDTLASEKGSLFATLKGVVATWVRPLTEARVHQRPCEAVTSSSWMIIYKPLYLLWATVMLSDFYRRYGREVFFYAAERLGRGGLDKDTVMSQLGVEGRTQFRVIEGVEKRFTQVAGVRSLIPELGELIFSLRRGRRYRKGGGFKGLLLVGPPGTGKTFLVQALAGESEVPAVVQSAASFQDSKGGESACDELKALFDRARELSPCILFLDEVDSLGASREGVMTTAVGEQGDVLESIELAPKLRQALLAEERKILQQQPTQSERVKQGDREKDQPFELKPLSQELSAPQWESDAAPVLRSYQSRRAAQKKRSGLMMQFLTEMDGLRGLEGVLVIGATNRPEVLDPAVTRPGRFDRALEVGLPGREKRVEILKMYTRHMGVDSTVAWEYLASRTAGLTAADMASALNYSAIRAVLEESSHTIETIEHGLETVSRQPRSRFLSPPGESGDPDFSLQRSAYYQAGRAVLQTILPGHPPVAYLSLSVQGGEREKALLQFGSHTRTRRVQLETLLLGCYGGKAGELILISHATSPIRKGGDQWFERMAAWQSDLGTPELSRALFLARDMVDRWSLYSQEVPLWLESGIEGNRNKKELDQEAFSLSLFPYLAQRNENEIRERTDLQDEHLNLSPPAWWQAQVTKQAIYVDVSVQEWFRIYIPNPEERERNIYWLPPDQFYHTANYSRTLLKGKEKKNSILWNNLYRIHADSICHGLISACFQKAFSLLDKRRELLDLVASHLITHKMIRQHEIALILSKFQGVATLSPKTVIFKDE